MKILLCPGLDGTAKLFGPLIDILPRHLEPVPIAFPPDSSLEYADLAEIIRNQIPNEKFAILAESFSGPAAVQVARSCDGRLVGLVLSSSFVSNPSPFPSWLVSLLSRKEILRWCLRIPMGRYVLGRNTSSEVVGLFDSVIQNLSPPLVSKRILQVLTCDSREDLLQCPAPVLDLRPSQDWFVSKNYVASIRKLGANMFMEEIAGTHFLLQSNPREAAASIVNFLEVVVNAG